MDATKDDLYWYRLITMIWAHVQFITVFALIAYVTGAAHLAAWEKVSFFWRWRWRYHGHHWDQLQPRTHAPPKKLERHMADFLLCMVMYSHFRSEHMLVHHRYVVTPRDPVTARMGEHFYRYFPRVLRNSFISALGAEAAMIARKDLPATNRGNPFWKYAALQGGFLFLALVLGGWASVGLFLLQAGIAIWQLELVNFIEHYGLIRKHMGEGKYEHVQPRHSWNAAHKASNWLLINLQRHSDHHYKPDRRFPVLQTYTEADAPQLPCGYPIMTMAAMYPPMFRRIMNPRVRKWREIYYPEITDWSAYNTAKSPMPR